MDTKYCKKCDTDKPLDSFHKSKKDGLHNYCKACSKTYRRENYLANAEKYKQQVKIYADDLKHEHRVLKESSPCLDCGKYYPYWVMDFDHRDPEAKAGHVSDLARYSREVAQREIAKCDLVCANCHRDRTAIRAGWL